MQRQNMQTDDVVRGADSALADIFYGLLRDVGARTKLTSNDRMLAELAALMADAERGLPYEGAKEHYILDIDDTDLARQVVAVLETVTPLPKPKKKKAE